MEVNSAKAFRSNFKERRYRQDVNPDFMGYSRDENGKFKEYGFFNLFHGEKPNIDQYLPSLLDIAEDNQAIYEFLQNAVDCKATSFWAFYDDNYFLAINNGAKFDQEGLTSILNIAQSTKKDPDSIGRLGIGFKLVHRLVGKGNGVKELLEAQKGPIVFSWGSASQLEAMMNIGEQIVHDGFSENKPYLLKICLTNFPTDVDETVIGVNGDTIVPFRESELKELRMYTSRCMQKIFNENHTLLNNGTLFFIKLGENKKILLDSDLNTLRNGIEYSMNKLKQLNKIWFNSELIYKKNLEIIDGSIKSGTELFEKLDIDARYKDYDVLYSFGYIPLDFDKNDYYTTVSQLRQSPNFYKYFPMGDEVNNMALFVHCDSFQIEANRRKLTKHHTNELLLPE
ncbi:MAG: ATP-binding protein, partial [Paludibacteraceae bacterium]|nr:ATP-binding protein [Paludibacteraceae bacterium]